jgi:hypothetical protein
MSDPVLCTGCDGCHEGCRHETCQTGAGDVPPCDLAGECTCELETCPA